jgi:membrane associated rhomboid family serine protease
MLIPLGTDRPLKRPTVVTYALVVANVCVFIAMSALERLDPHGWEVVQRALWLDPSRITPWNLLTYAFLHAGFLHLLGNMLFLWTFGPNVEDRFGRAGFFVFYLAGAGAAGGLHALFERANVVGASGAIAAVTGAYLVLFPRTQVRCFYIIFLGMTSVPAWWFIGFAVAWDFLYQGTGARDGVAHLAHLGGYAMGVGVSVVLLWTRTLAREPYDLFTMGRQAYRRRQFREVALRQQAEIERRLDPARSAAGARIEELAAARARVVGAAQKQDLDGAAAAFKELVERFAPEPGATLLSKRCQLDVGNHLFSLRDHASAAYCYERFLEAYDKDPEAPRIRLMLGLINARYLNDPVRARQLLSGLPPALHVEGDRELAQTLLEELG